MVKSEYSALEPSRGPPHRSVTATNNSTNERDAGVVQKDLISGADNELRGRRGGEPGSHFDSKVPAEILAHLKPPSSTQEGNYHIEFRERGIGLRLIGKGLDLPSDCAGNRSTQIGTTVSSSSNRRFWAIQNKSNRAVSDYTTGKTTTVDRTNSFSSDSTTGGNCSYNGKGEDLSEKEDFKQVLRSRRRDLKAVRDFERPSYTHSRPKFDPEQVEALLSRRPNSVRDIVNSLNRYSSTNSFVVVRGSSPTGTSNTADPTTINSVDITTSEEGLDSKMNTITTTEGNSLIYTDTISTTDGLIGTDRLGGRDEDGVGSGHFDQFKDFINFDRYLNSSAGATSATAITGGTNYKAVGTNSFDDVVTFRNDNTNWADHNAFFNPLTTTTITTTTGTDGLYYPYYITNYGDGKEGVDEVGTPNSNITRLTNPSTPLNSTTNCFLAGSTTTTSDDGVKIEDLLFSKRFLQSFNTLPEGVNLTIDTPTSNTTTNSFVIGRGSSTATTTGSGGGSQLPTAKRQLVEGVATRGTWDNVILIKEGWVWVQGIRNKNWVPKYMSLFYCPSQSTATTGSGGGSQLPTALKQLVEGVDTCDYNRYFHGSNKRSNEGFWSIYQLYSQMSPTSNGSTITGSNRAAKSSSPTVTTKFSSSPTITATFGTTTSNSSKGTSGVRDPNKCYSQSVEGSSYQSLKAVGRSALIRPDSTVYIALFNQQISHLPSSLRNKEYLQLYRVDSRVPPALKSFNSCWLTRVIARRLNRSLELIVIPLEDEYEICFVPLMAAKLNQQAVLNYGGELCRKRSLEEEYDEWVFKLWEYSLRQTSTNSSTITGSNRAAISSITTTASSTEGTTTSCSGPNDLSTTKGTTTTTSGSTLGVGMISRWISFICDFFSASGGGKEGEEGGVKGKVGDDLNFRRLIIKSIHNVGPNVTASEFGEDRLEVDNSGGDLPSPQNFLNWINKYGFDDLSIKMNMYSIVNRP